MTAVNDLSARMCDHAYTQLQSGDLGRLQLAETGEDTVPLGYCLMYYIKVCTMSVVVRHWQHFKANPSLFKNCVEPPLPGALVATC